MFYANMPFPEFTKAALPEVNSVVVPHRLNHAHSDRNLMPSVVKVCNISPKNRTTTVPHAD